jgi:dolichol-phosphate mannosyltransferase
MHAPVPELSVVVPVHNEEANVAPLVDEIVAALRGRVPFEIVYVDDASRDGTPRALEATMARVPELRVVRHLKQSGQSAALRTGVAAARGVWVATLDGDGQNDPADLPKLLDARAHADPTLKLFAGWRVDRRDTFVRRLSSKVANAVRSAVLKDDTPDTGCGTKLFERQAYLDLPAFDHMHRFLPALFRRAGWQVRSVPVRHRPRTRGVSKYGIGNRLFVGIVDLFGVAWLMRRVRLTDTVEIRRDTPAGSA